MLYTSHNMGPRGTLEQAVHEKQCAWRNDMFLYESPDAYFVMANDDHPHVADRLQDTEFYLRGIIVQDMR